MSSEASIRLAGVGKTFSMFRHPAGRLIAALTRRPAGKSLQALSGVNLVAGKGECVGIIGRNGAGKSTLLQVVSGVMTPTTGTVETHGRIAAMLQLGAGFNREFTGRQNALLAAAIYGLGPSQIEARMPAIEAFAGIGDKIDRPVREYSSGMFARLAFAVCANVDPDILIVDEILGVGDSDFQQRSMRFLRQFRRKGLVLFVSHDEHAVSALCDRVVWIEAGRVIADGSARPVLRRYRSHMAALVAGAEGLANATNDSDDLARIALQEPAPAEGFDPDNPPEPSGRAEIRRVAVSSAAGGQVAFAGGEVVALHVEAKAGSDLDVACVIALMRNPMGQVVIAFDSRRLAGGAELQLRADRRLDVEFRFRLPFLPTGVYAVDALVLSGRDGQDRVEAMSESAATLRVVSTHVSAGLANIRMDKVSVEKVASGERA
ncbi:MAG: ABC transporter ATP-binding protein [Mesorhizobium sp.]